MKATVLTIMFIIFTTCLSALTGFGVSAPLLNDTVNPAVTLLTPLSVDTWYVGQMKDITWTASDSNLLTDGINLYYSLDGGLSFYPLTGNLANTGSFTLQIPAIECDITQVRVKATDSFGNFTQEAHPLVLSYTPPRQVQNVEVAALGTDVIISWQAVTQSVLNEAFTPDGYMLFYCETASANRQDFTLLATTNQTFYSDPDATWTYGQRFYYVVAYKNYTVRAGINLEQDEAPAGLPDIRSKKADKKAGGGK